MDGIGPSVAGNPACWHDIFNFDYCCHQRHGPAGNAECWDGYFNFNHCCYTPLHVASPAECWAEARQNLAQSEETAAKHPVLKEPANLATFCCHASSLSSHACWGAGRGGSPELRDASTGETLGFTRRHIDCCFPELKKLAREAAPQWMTNQINDDLKEWENQGPFTGASLDRMEEAYENLGRAADVCRFSIRSGDEIYHCDFSLSRYYSLLHALRAALLILHVMFGLPEMDFLVHTNEYYGITPTQEVNLTAPVLVQAQVEGNHGILMPWWAFLQWDWTRRYRDRLEESSKDIQWEDRDDLLFWRGSDTGCLLSEILPPSRAKTVWMPCANWTQNTWPLFPRSKLVLASSFFPTRIDAVFTKDTVHLDCQDVYDATGLRVEEIVPPEAHVRHKYLAYVDGTSFSDRLFWLLLTDSLVFKAGSSIRVWLDAGLQAWTHYVPVHGNLSDLFDQLDWAKKNDAESARMASEAARFAKSDLTLEASLLYLYHLLSRLGNLIHLTPEEIDAPAKMPKIQVEPLEESELDCWALGFSFSLCCNVEQHGPGGNSACWDGPYSFELCCQGDSFGAKKLKLKEKITTVLAARDGDLSSFGRS